MGTFDAAWVIRSGKGGERDQWCLANNVAGGGWTEYPDLRGKSKEQIAAIVESIVPNAKQQAKTVWIGQTNRLVNVIRTGDLVVLPLKTTAQIAFGRVTTGYDYLDNEDPTRRHVVHVEWLRTDLPRSAVKQDLLYSLGSALTTFGVTKNNALERLTSLAEHGVDPGKVIHTLPGATKESDAEAATGEDDADLALDIERFTRDQVSAYIAENFAGHRLQDLVSAVLRAHGYQTEVAPPGPDGGVDIRAGRGALGLEPPYLIVQVKSEATPVGSPVVQQLQGAMAKASSSRAQTGALLVAMGGLKSTAQKAIADDWFDIRVWDSDDLVDAIFDVYPALDEETKASLPLRSVWTLVPPDED